MVPGDRVDIVGDTSGDEGSLSRIVRIEERRTVLRRTADDTDPVERIIVANADQLVIVTALADPEPRTRMIDRCVAAAYDARMDAAARADQGRPGGPRRRSSACTRRSASRWWSPARRSPSAADHRRAGRRARRRWTGKTSVLVGHSGVGKSTLVNALVPGTERAVGRRQRRDRPRPAHVQLRGGAAGARHRAPTWVIDTPGVRSFGLAHVDPQHLLGAFADLAAVAEECPRGCTHADDAPDCALDEWVEASPDEVDACGPVGSRRVVPAAAGQPARHRRTDNREPARP